MIYTKETMKSFKEIVEPVMKWLNENCHPHTSIVIGSDIAELMEGQITHHTEQFLKK